MEQASALVYPSLDEGFGFPPLEAMRLGCPVAAARASCLPEILQETPCYFDPMDPADIALAIRQAAIPRGEQERRLQGARALASHFTWQSCARTTYEVYQRVLGSRSVIRS